MNIISQTIFSPWLTPVRVASTSNIAGEYSNGTQNNGIGATLAISASSLTIDGVVLRVGDRVLLRSQTSSKENGIYIFLSIDDELTAITLQRAYDQQSIEQYKIGQYVSVGAGASSAGFTYTVVEPLPNRLGIDSLIWTPTASSTGFVELEPTADQTITEHNLQLADGDFIAGAIGVEGKFVSHAFGDSGSFIFGATEGIGSNDVLFSNLPFAQSSFIYTPDPGNFQAVNLVAPTLTPFIDGNFPMASGIQGLLVDSGVSAASLSDIGKTLYVDVDITAADVTTNAYIVPPGGSNRYRLRNCMVNLSEGLVGGNKDVVITDGSGILITITSALALAPVNTIWGTTDLQLSSGLPQNQISGVGSGYYLIGFGGTTDYTSGSINISLTYERVA